MSTFPLPPDLPRPIDDGAANHLVGMTMARIRLQSTSDQLVDLAALGDKRTVIYIYPRTGVPGIPLLDGWDLIPGARGCTPQSCGFRDHHRELAELGARVFGLSTQTTEYQSEMATRLELPFEVLSDSGFELTNALRLPTFETAGLRLLKRLTLVIRAGCIEHVFYPVFPPDESAERVIEWLRANPI
jgi:peroxiredoxin